MSEARLQTIFEESIPLSTYESIEESPPASLHTSNSSPYSKRSSPNSSSLAKSFSLNDIYNIEQMAKLAPHRLTPEQLKVLLEYTPDAFDPISHPKSSLQPNPKDKKRTFHEPLELVYNLHHKKFRLQRASVLLAPTPSKPRRRGSNEDKTPNPYTLLSPTIADASIRESSLHEEVPSRTRSPIRRSCFLTGVASEAHLPQPRSSLKTKASAIKQVMHRKLHPSTYTPKETYNFQILAGDCPPMLVDGKKFIVEFPRWKRNVDFLLNTGKGRKGMVVCDVKLPLWVWWRRNFGLRVDDGVLSVGRWNELWIERI